jgi:hypothetical protein
MSAHECALLLLFRGTVCVMHTMGVFGWSFALLVLQSTYMMLYAKEGSSRVQNEF